MSALIPHPDPTSHHTAGHNDDPVVSPICRIYGCNGISGFHGINDAVYRTADRCIDDTPEDCSTLIKRILSAKLFEDANGGAWKRNIKDIEGEILCGASQILMA